MRVTLGQPALRDLLVAVKPFISGRSPLPILNNYLLGVKDGILSVLGNDMEISMTTGINVLGAEDGRITLPAKQLLDIVGKLPADGVTISSENGIDTLITCRRSKFNLRGVRAEEYTMPPAAIETSAMSLDAKLLADILSRTIYAARTTDEVLGGCWLRVRDNILEVAAMDGFRMAYWKQTLEGEVGDFERTVPRRGMTELARLARTAEGPILIKEAGSCLAFELPGTYMTTRVLDGAYPAFHAILPDPKKYIERITVDKAALAEAVDRVSVMTSELEADIITLSIEGTELAVRATRAEQGGGEDFVNCSPATKPFSIYAKAGYLAEALRASGDEVEICYLGPKLPITLRTPDDDRLISIVMPFSMDT